MKVTEYRAARAAAMSEDALLAGVRKLARDLGLLTYHVHDSRRSERGFPDLVIVGTGVMFRELKKEDGRVTKDQRDWLDRLQKAGADADVWRPHDLLDQTVLTELRELL